jgi:Putative phage tail protein
VWLQFFLWIASFVLSDLFREKLPAQTPSGIGDFKIPTATEGRVVPIVIGGTVRIEAPNCIWYGDFAAIERTVTTGVIFRDEETIGYTYELALQYALFKGEAFGITGVWIGDDKVFDHVTDAASVPQSVVDVNRPDLFGGEDSGGGFVGRLRLFNGSDTQAVSAFLATRLDPLPAYRGTCYVMITDPTETKGANIGESNNVRYIRVEVQTFSTVAQGALGDVMNLGNDHHFIGPDANPISVGYALYVNNRWGRAFPPSDVNLASFQTAAETVYTEGIGFTQLIDEQTSSSDIQETIEQHCDCYIGPNPLTGQIEVTLSRADYTLASEFQADTSNILKVKRWSKGDWSQTFNRVRIRYTDRAKAWKETHAIELAAGNRIIQGTTKTKELRFQGCHTAAVASKLAARTKRQLAQPTEQGQLELNRTAYLKRPGDILSVTHPNAGGAVNLPVRITKTQVGDTLRNSILVDVVEDLDGTELANQVVPPASDFVPPIQAVVPFATADQAATEAPFVLMRYNPTANNVPRIATLARRAAGNLPTNYDIIRRTRATFGSGTYTAFSSGGNVASGFMTCGELRNAEGAWESGNGSLTMQVDPIGSETLDGLIGSYAPSAANAAGVAVISPGLADEEWLVFSSIVDDGTGIRLEGLYRAAMDTPMVAHASGARVWFIWTGGLGMTEGTFAAGSGAELKLLPASPSASVLEPAATALAEVHILNTIRDARPLLPVNLLLNGTSFPGTDVDFDSAVTGGPGLEITPTYRLWSVADVVDSVAARDNTGGAIGADDLADQALRVSCWVYNLDTHPTPVRANSLVTITDQAVTDQGEVLLITRAALISAGITVDFAARIEIETKHSPPGKATNQVSRSPLFFDFPAIGTW